MLAQMMLVFAILLFVCAVFGLLRFVKAWRRYRAHNNYLIVTCAGDCGTSFDFLLQMENGVVTLAESRGGGCAHSLICANAAAKLARGKTLAQLKEITPALIAKAAGGLDKQHWHCALLAAHGLKQAVCKFEQAATVKP